MKIDNLTKFKELLIDCNKWNYQHLFDKYSGYDVRAHQDQIFKMIGDNDYNLIGKYRQGGVSTALCFVAVIEMMRGKHVLLATSTNQMVDHLSKEIYGLLNDLNLVDMVINKKREQIEFWNRGSITFRSKLLSVGSNPLETMTNKGKVRFDLVLIDDYFNEKIEEVQNLNFFIELSHGENVKMTITTNDDTIFSNIKNYSYFHDLKLNWWENGIFNHNLKWFKKDHAPRKVSYERSPMECYYLFGQGWVPQSDWSEKMCESLGRKERFEHQYMTKTPLDDKTEECDCEKYLLEGKIIKVGLDLF